MKFAFAALAAVAVACSVTPALAGKTAPDDGLYSMYNVQPDGSFVLMSVCGDFGCESGFDHSFEHVCAMIESAPAVKDGVMTRDIFILDKRNSAASEMTLTVYHRVDTLHDGDRDLEITLTHTIPLGITGGPNAKCKMVENPKFVYLGTDLSDHAVRIDKKKFKASQAALGPTTLLAADSRGYVSISDNGGGGFVILDPRGGPVVSGGGVQTQVGDQTATLFP